MSERTIKEFVFNALLVQDSFNALEEEGISVSSSDDFVAISRVVERDFSPRVWADAIRMSSVYTALYCIENTIRDFMSSVCQSAMVLIGGKKLCQRKLEMLLLI